MITVEAHIVTYNSREVIGDCLASLIKYAPVDPEIDFRIAVLDNASSDHTAELVAAEFPEVTLTRNPANTYYGPASNDLVTRTTADQILVINPDTVVDDDVVTPLVAALAAHDDVALACPTITDEFGQVQPFVQRFPTIAFELARLVRGTKLGRLFGGRWDAARIVAERRDALPPADVPFAMKFVWSTAWLIRASVARAFPFSPEFPMYDTDVDVCRRMADAGLSAVYVPEATVRHIGGASSHPERKRRMEQSCRADYYRIYHGRAYALVFRGVSALWPRVVAAKRVLR